MNEWMNRTYRFYKENPRSDFLWVFFIQYLLFSEVVDVCMRVSVSVIDHVLAMPTMLSVYACVCGCVLYVFSGLWDQKNKGDPGHVYVVDNGFVLHLGCFHLIYHHENRRFESPTTLTCFQYTLLFMFFPGIRGPDWFALYFYPVLCALIQRTCHYLGVRKQSIYQT